MDGSFSMGTLSNQSVEGKHHFFFGEWTYAFGKQGLGVAEQAVHRDGGGGQLVQRGGVDQSTPSVGLLLRAALPALHRQHASSAPAECLGVGVEAFLPGGRQPRGGGDQFADGGDHWGIGRRREGGGVAVNGLAEGFGGGLVEVLNGLNQSPHAGRGWGEYGTPMREDREAGICWRRAWGEGEPAVYGVLCRRSSRTR
jgi:hypothetical protein